MSNNIHFAKFNLKRGENEITNKIYTVFVFCK